MRIRSVKPEFWKSEAVARLPHFARLLFIGLWNLADDYGRFRAHPALVKGELFAYDESVPVGTALMQLAEAGLVVLYEVGGGQFGWVRNFTEHQKIDRRTPSRLPPPPAESAGSAETPAGSTDFQVLELGGEQGRGGDQGLDRGQERSMALPRAGARGGEGPAARQGPEASPIAELTDALMATRFRCVIGNAIQRRAAVRDHATRLHAAGLTPHLVGQLVELSALKSRSDPGALLAHWLAGDWRGVLDEQAEKRRHMAAKARSADEAVDGGKAVDRGTGEAPGPLHEERKE